MLAYHSYDPLNTPKRVADHIWVVDGPEITMQYAGIGLPFPTRMTVVRLPTGKLWVHSPIACNDLLVSALSELGPVAFLVAPSTLHYWYLPDWQKIFPNARTFAPPSLTPNSRRQFRIDESLGDFPPEEWREVMGQCLINGGLMTEVDFFHRPSRTLILTDLIENFETSRVRKHWLRWVMKLFGAADPDGKAPYDMQLSFIGHRAALRRAVKRMIDWAPERIIIAHGKWYDRHGVAELQRAFRWVL